MIDIKQFLLVFLGCFLKVYPFLFLFTVLRNVLSQLQLVSLALVLTLPYFMQQKLLLVESDSMVIYLLLLMQQLLSGILLAIPFVFILDVLPTFHKTVDLLRGIFAAEQQFPFSEQRQSPLESLGSLLAVLIFFQSDLLHGALNALYGNEISLQSHLNFNFFHLIEKFALSFKVVIVNLLPFISYLLILELLFVLLSKYNRRLALVSESSILRLLSGLIFYLLLLRSEGDLFFKLVKF